MVFIMSELIVGTNSQSGDERPGTASLVGKGSMKEIEMESKCSDERKWRQVHFWERVEQNWMQIIGVAMRVFMEIFYILHAKVEAIRNPHTS
jgi:hypothetical protein